MVVRFKQVLSKRGIYPTLLMLEILEKAYNRFSHEPPYGMTELYESLPHPKPTFSSFRNQLSLLEVGECILIHPSKEKASKKSVILSGEFRNLLETDIYF